MASVRSLKITTGSVELERTLAMQVCASTLCDLCVGCDRFAKEYYLTDPFYTWGALPGFLGFQEAGLY